ncbi:MAG: putative O-glycosylation ligase, exosortase A system-associated [Candidatus Competibacter sp.]|nr:putative O-glycosylation ligase, exosortase A system-associated [Candidatus Competibacter sp.]
MRDIFVTLLILGPLLFAFTRPWLGVALYVFVSVGVPHQMTWGFATTLPFAQVVAIVTLLALIFSREPKRFPITGLTVTMLAFFAWMTVTTLFALEPQPSWEKWYLVFKIMFMVFVALVIVQEKKHIEWLMAALVLTVGFYAVKGGIWTLLGGGGRVYGPPGGFISENNSFALAVVMTIPLVYYFYLRVNDRWIKRGLLLMMVLCSASALGSFSRGALLAISAMAVMLWWKSKQKMALAVGIVLLIPLLLLVMPEQWGERMSTIQTYEQDNSAMTRLMAWETMFSIAKHRFLGGGFSIASEWIYKMYSPYPDMGSPVAHSIYFAVLGEHGFIGLGLFLMIGWISLRTADGIVNATQSIPDLRWANELARMIKVSLVGFAVGGAFLSMQYFEMPYFLLVALTAMRILVEREAKPALVWKEQGPKTIQTGVVGTTSSTARFERTLGRG